MMPDRQEGGPAAASTTSDANAMTMIPAATVIFYRSHASGLAQHLMIERTQGMTFAAGALTFPGGRIDEDDHVIAAAPQLWRNGPADEEERAHRIGAIRESLEETGMAVGIDPAPSSGAIGAWRKALKDGACFSALLRETGSVLDLGVLHPWARWCPKFTEKRRFDTRFYIARAWGDHDHLEGDADEVAMHRWISAREAIDGAAANLYKIIFPTLRNLERLAAYPRFEDALAHVAQIPVQTISPEIRVLGGEQWLCIPENAGYPVTKLPLAAVLRS